MNRWLQRNKKYFKDKKFLVSLTTTLVIFGLCIIVNFYAGNYATKSASNPVTDIILSNTRVYDVDGIFTYGAILFWILLIGLSLHRPNKIPFIFKSLSLFIIIRSIFISLTHLGPFPTHAWINPASIISDFSFGGDLFFSGHTGLPFLMALIFWHDKFLRILFLAVSIIFGIAVLLGHLHYSIDVLGAFFITYTIFHLSELYFKKDWKVFMENREMEP